jgi:hypothetical protein
MSELTLKYDPKHRARELDRIVTAKADRRNLDMLTPSRLTRWSRIDTNINSTITKKPPPPHNLIYAGKR